MAISEALQLIIVGARQVLDRRPTHHEYQLIFITALDQERKAILVPEKLNSPLLMNVCFHLPYEGPGCTRS